MANRRVGVRNPRTPTTVSVSTHPWRPALSIQSEESAPRNEPLDVVLRDNQIRIGAHFSVNLQRTLRLPDDGQDHPLPPGLGQFPIERVSDHGDRAPASMREVGGFIVGMHPREALWLSFWAPHWRPCALKAGAGRINAISGAPWSPELADDPDQQDYVVPPDQPWLDGFNAGDGIVRQFVAVPLGHGYTAEEQITGRAEFGGIQLRVFDPKPGRFEAPPSRDLARWDGEGIVMECCDSGGSMGLGAGGSLLQEIYPDPHGFDTWDQERVGETFIHLLDPDSFRVITGREVPPSPVSAELYTELGLPWFELDPAADVAPSGKLAGLKSLAKLDQEHGVPSATEETPIEVPGAQIKKLAMPKSGTNGN